MPAISSEQVKALRDETGLPMMECKSALTEAGGDTEQAKNLLQKKFKGKMESRAGNVTGEGRIAFWISPDRKSGVIADVRCETAPVAKTEQFIGLANLVVQSIAKQADAQPTPEKAAAYPSPTRPGKTVQDELTDVFGVLRENIKIFNCRKLTGGYLCAYVHHDGKTGVMLALDAPPKPESAGVDLCHHVVFTNPMAITRQELPQDQIEKVRQLARELAVSEGKPAGVLDKIVEGKVNAYCAENSLMEQEHVKAPKTKVSDVLKAAGVQAVTGLVYFKIG